MPAIAAKPKPVRPSLSAVVADTDTGALEHLPCYAFAPPASTDLLSVGCRSPAPAALPTHAGDQNDDMAQHVGNYWTPANGDRRRRTPPRRLAPAADSTASHAHECGHVNVGGPAKSSALGTPLTSQQRTSARSDAATAGPQTTAGRSRFTRALRLGQQQSSLVVILNASGSPTTSAPGRR